MLASVASHASTSANSSTRSSCVPPRSAADNSPTSSMNHMNVPSMPRAPSLAPYMVRISSCNWFRVIVSEAACGFAHPLILQQFLQPCRFVVLFLPLQRLEHDFLRLFVLEVDLQ